MKEMVSELKLRCNCNINTSHISSTGFRCFSSSSNAVTFRGLISGLSQVAAPQLIDYLEDWISSGTTISVQAQLLSIEADCSVAISSLGEEGCQPSSPASNISTALLGSVVVIVVFIAMVIMAIVIVVLTLLKRRAKPVVIEQTTLPQE